MEKFKINTLFDIAFGIKSVAAFQIDQTSVPPGSNISFSGVEVIDDIETASRLSHLGTPIIFPMTLKGKTYQVYSEIGEMDLKGFEDFEMPATVLVNFSRAKIISKTKALAANGTVKELYGFDDWQIDIRGLCLADSSHATAKTAREQIKKLYEFEKIADSVEVLGALFSEKNISNIVIEKINIVQLKGKPGVIPFHMKCVSDEPIELFI